MATANKRLGELVLRSENAPELVDFYREVIGLELFNQVGSATFLKIADDFEGHPQLLAIFETNHTFSGPRDLHTKVADSAAGTLHHFAFALEKENFFAEQERLKELGVTAQMAEHAKFGWRSLYLFDPDGNSVELVCHDPDIMQIPEIPAG